MVELLVTNLPIILCVLCGMALITLEVMLPGFGVPGISGIVLLVVGIALTISAHGMLAGLGVLIMVIAILAIVISIALKSAANGKLSKSKLILNDTAIDQDKEQVQQEDLRELIGREGKTGTVLRPAGIAEFDGVRLNVVTEGEFIDKDKAVAIVSVEGSRIVVRACA